MLRETLQVKAYAMESEGLRRRCNGRQQWDW